jgi:hypothetical protein
MRVAFGFKAHSGWAALVVIGAAGTDFHVIDRRRVELIEEGELWAKQPYHAAEDLAGGEARDVVKSGVESAHHVAVHQMREAVTRIRQLKHEIACCAVLVPEPMPKWSTDEILAVHFRMHKAEGVLFPDALCRAVRSCKLPLVPVPEKRLDEYAEKALAAPLHRSMETIAKLGKSVGPPWGKDQKNATLAAMIALRGNVKSSQGTIDLSPNY